MKPMTVKENEEVNFINSLIELIKLNRVQNFVIAVETERGSMLSITSENAKKLISKLKQARKDE